MARRTARTQPINTALPKGRKSTQRERILNGMVVAANRDGYLGATVTEIIAQAGVSRPTFYDYFADRDDCFLATIADIQGTLVGDVRRAVQDGPPADAVAATITAIVSFASAQPSHAHFLMGESMAGGPRALDLRDRGIAELRAIIDTAHGLVEGAAAIPDVDAGAMVGGLYRLLAPRLRRGEPSVLGLAEELVRWSATYARPARELRWRALKPSRPPARSPFLTARPMAPPPRLPPGRPKLSNEQVASNHRQRILYTAAQLATDKGYGATTIAEITGSAGIDGRSFYGLFVDKQDVFMTLHELGLQQLLAVISSAFFAGASWPERVWEGMRALTQLLQSDPLVAHTEFVEAHAIGSSASQRVYDSHAAFAIFLQEGYLHTEERPAPTPAALEAIVTTLFEIVYSQARAEKKPKLAGLLGQITFLCLAPFLGAAQASSFAQAKQLGTRRAPSAREGNPAA